MLIDAPEIAFSLLKQAQQRELVRSAIRRVTGRAYKLGPYKRIEGEREKDALEGLLERAREAGVRVEESGA